MYTHRREEKAAGLDRPGRLAERGRDNVGAKALEEAAEAAAGLSFKLWSEARGAGGCHGVGVGDGALVPNHLSSEEDDQSSLSTLVGHTYCSAGHGVASSSPAFALFEGKSGTGITVKTAAAAPTSDFGVTAAVRQLGGGIVGAGAEGSEVSVAASGVAPALVEPDRPVRRPSCTLVQLSTRCVCLDERRMLIVHVQVLHGLCPDCRWYLEKMWLRVRYGMSL